MAPSRASIIQARSVLRNLNSGKTGRGSVWLERLLWEQEVDSSSLSAPMLIKGDKFPPKADQPAAGKSCRPDLNLIICIKIAPVAQLDRATAF